MSSTMKLYISKGAPTSAILIVQYRIGAVIIDV
jgi:hypothetical protein